MTSVIGSSEPWLKSWPCGGLEQVTTCPVCRESHRNLLYADLVDNVFHTAPGKWMLWSCTSCRTAYLDPRPSSATIHLAYANYYTHQISASREDYTTLGILRKLRRCFINGYTNWRYGTRSYPSCLIGVILVYLIPRIKSSLDGEYRHMPRHSKRGSLLDVGCGNGAFLRIAQSCGWEVRGVDPDHKAVMNCQMQGFNVLEGGVEQFEKMSNLFDVITLNHVIEHVHNPLETLRTCRRLLKPGGVLWLATPNINSLGHKKYGRYWRGLESPRHLLLFNPSSLSLALELSGFKRQIRVKGSSPLRSMTKASEAVRKGVTINQNMSLSAIQSFMVLTRSFYQDLFANSREFLTMIAYKD